jgi:hypothetical protein
MFTTSILLGSTAVAVLSRAAMDTFFVLDGHQVVQNVLALPVGRLALVLLVLHLREGGFRRVPSNSLVPVRQLPVVFPLGIESRLELEPQARFFRGHG